MDHRIAGEVMWVTRTLVLPPAGETEPSRSGVTVGDRDAALARLWLGHLAGTREWAQVEELLDADHERDHVTRWLNYVYVRRNRLDDLVEALRLAQYHYAALELADHDLTAILNRTAGADHLVDLDRLRMELETATLRTQLITLERPDSARYLARTVLQELDEVLDYWDYDGALLEPVTRKTAAATEQLRQLEAQAKQRADEAAARSRRYTDLILLGLTVTTITGTMLAIADFGRASAANPQVAAFDVERDAFVQFLASQSANAIVGVSLVVSLVIAAVYWFLSSSQRQ